MVIVPADRDIPKASSNPVEHSELARKMSENFTGVYLTMLSIIQGVALTDLAAIAFSQGAHLSVTQWVQVATMLWTLIYIWNHFMADALMTQWIPDIEDAALLFGTGVLELLANHGIIWGVPTWLGALSAMLFLWALGSLYIRQQEEEFVQDPVLMKMLRARTRPILWETIGGGTFLCLLAILCAVTGAKAHSSKVEQNVIASASVGIALLISAAIGIVSSKFWKRVRAYARKGSEGA